MKTFIFAFMMIFANLAHADSPAPFACLDMESPTYAKVKAEMIATAQQIATMHPELTKYGFGYGNCMDLQKSSVLAHASGQVLTNLPETCVGFSLGAASQRELPLLARRLVGIQDSLIDGKNGSMILSLDGDQANVPICLESFSFDGPR